jgi:hypothetical protein
MKGQIYHYAEIVNFANFMGQVSSDVGQLSSTRTLVARVGYLEVVICYSHTISLNPLVVGYDTNNLCEMIIKPKSCS